MRYDTIDGFRFEADSAARVVARLKASSPFRADESDADFMRGVAERCLLWSGAVIRVDDCESFVQDLLAAGFLRVLPGP